MIMHNSALDIRESECLSDKLIRLTQQTGDNEANAKEFDFWESIAWYCEGEIPKKGGKECNSVDKSSELICLDGPGLANFTPQSHVFIYIW